MSSLFLPHYLLELLDSKALVAIFTLYLKHCRSVLQLNKAAGLTDSAFGFLKQEVILCFEYNVLTELKYYRGGSWSLTQKHTHQLSSTRFHSMFECVE